MKEKKAVKKKSSRRVGSKINLRPMIGIAYAEKSFESQLKETEATCFESILNRLEVETNHSMSVGLDINNKLHNIKWNDPEKGNGDNMESKGNDDLVGKINLILEKLSNANKIHDKNIYKLNKLF